MRLLAYLPGANIPRTLGSDYVRALVIDCPAPGIAEGYHEELQMFNVIVKNADVFSLASEQHGHDLIYVCVKNMSDVVAAFDTDICTTQDYQFWMGDNASAPNSDDIISAHIIKGHLPDLHKDFDAFVEWLFSEMRKVPRINIDHMVLKGKGVLYDANTKQRYDLWQMYRNYLMLDGAIAVGYSLDNFVTLSDLHISDKGVNWWLQEHNRQLMELAAEHNLLACYVTFGTDSRNNEDFAYTFVSREGNYMRRPVEVNEFLYMAMHGVFPKLTCHGTDRHFNVTFEYAEYFPLAYHNYANHKGDEHSRNLSRFI